MISTRYVRLRAAGIRIAAVDALFGCTAATCAGTTVPHAPPETIKIFKYDGSVQCSPGSGVPVDRMEHELTGAGIEVLSREKANDGLIHPQVCGASTGMINVYEIRAAALDQAKSLG